MDQTTPSWTKQEFAKLNLGDGCLNKVARKLTERFSAQPGASIPQACDTWGETCVAYRFLGNDAV